MRHFQVATSCKRWAEEAAGEISDRRLEVNSLRIYRSRDAASFLAGFIGSGLCVASRRCELPDFHPSLFAPGFSKLSIAFHSTKVIVFLLSEDFELNSATDNTENWSFFFQVASRWSWAQAWNGRRANSSASESFAHGVAMWLVRWSDDRIYYAKIKTITKTNKLVGDVWRQSSRNGRVRADPAVNAAGSWSLTLSIQAGCFYIAKLLKLRAIASDPTIFTPSYFANSSVTTAVEGDILRVCTASVGFLAVSFPFVCCYFATATRKVEVGRACMRYSDPLGLKVIADVKNLKIFLEPSRLATGSRRGNEMSLFSVGTDGMIVQIPGGKLIRPNIALFPNTSHGPKLRMKRRYLADPQHSVLFLLS